jgi:hypothetical protein
MTSHRNTNSEEEDGALWRRLYYPERASWTEIGMDGLDLFTDDSGSVVLGLTDN